MKQQTSVWKRLFTPNESLLDREKNLLIIGWIIILLVGWQFFHPIGVPTPTRILGAFPSLITKLGVIEAWVRTIKLSLTAITISSTLALAITYLAVLPAWQPVTTAITKLRFLSIVGLVAIFTSLFHVPVYVRLAALVFGITPFMVTSMWAVVKDRDQRDYHYAQTMGYSSWQTAWHVVIRESASQMLEAIRQNLAIAFVMVVTVESRIREGGGLGTLLFDIETRRAKYDEVFAVMLIILLTGILLDIILLKLNKRLFPYAFLTKKD